MVYILDHVADLLNLVTANEITQREMERFGNVIHAAHHIVERVPLIPIAIFFVGLVALFNLGVGIVNTLHIAKNSDAIKMLGVEVTQISKLEVADAKTMVRFF